MEVKLDRINKKFGAVHVLKDIDLVFPSRKFVTLLGPSGCGKTTLLRMIAGLEEVTEGAIYFGGRDVTRLAPRDRNIAMVFQSYALYPQMTVRKNLGYGLRVRKTPKAEIDAAVERVAKILEIDHLLDRKPGQLSGGQRQRVALGRAMVRKPDIFLMDEPLSNLDAKLRVTMRGELRKFHLDLNATTIYVTHDQLEAMTMSDYIAVMHQGVLQQFGTPAEIYNKPANIFVASFIGSPPMNFLTGVGQGQKILVNGITLNFSRLSSEASSSELRLGIRPQDIVFVEPSDNSMRGVISLIELLGSEKLVEVKLEDGKPLIVQVSADYPSKYGEVVHLQIRPEKLHVFNALSGRSVREDS
ncbi:MAG TPA: ABC transporter ATP-binding protein [Hyphomicrobium sp.]|nr:ABC transporter ATP-binding protein [Hyphomicrobium sp.]